MTSAEADRAIAVLYAPAPARAGLSALLAFDAALGGVLQTVREPMVAQMRFTWWHDAIAALDGHAPPAQPVLQDLAHHVVPRLAAASLLPIVEGWEELLQPGLLPQDALERFAEARGGTMFAAMAALLDVADADRLRRAGQAWALYDLATHVSEAELAARARTLADAHVAALPRLAGRERAPGALMHLARLHDARGGRRLARLLFHRATGL